MPGSRPAPLAALCCDGSRSNPTPHRRAGSWTSRRTRGCSWARGWSGRGRSSRPGARGACRTRGRGGPAGGRAPRPAAATSGRWRRCGRAPPRRWQRRPRGGPSCGPSTRPSATPGARRAAPRPGINTPDRVARPAQCFPNSLWDQRDHDLRPKSAMGASCDLDALVVGCTPGAGRGFASSSLCARPAGAAAGPRADGAGAGVGAGVGAAVAVIETAKQAAIAAADGVLWSPVWGGVARPDSA